MKNLFLFRAAILACLLPILSSCLHRGPETYKKSRVLMDTYVTITVVSDSEKEAEKAIDAAFDGIAEFAGLIDFFSDKSELAEINRQAGISAVKVSPYTLNLVQKAVETSRLTDGAFDPTVGPLMKLWDFQKKTRPADSAIREALHLVDYRKIVIDPAESTVFLREKGMLLDLGSIAKGYAADIGVDELKRKGIKSGIVAAAGDIRTFGAKPDGSPWVVGIKNPRPKNEKDDLLGRLSLKDRAVSTAGDYERFFILDGKRYHHILVPQTGMPADKCIGVTVVADSGIKTDAYDTAIFVMGPRKGLDLVRKLGMEAVIIDDMGAMHATPAMKELLKLEENNK